VTDDKEARALLALPTDLGKKTLGSGIVELRKDPNRGFPSARRCSQLCRRPGTNRRRAENLVRHLIEGGEESTHDLRGTASSLGEGSLVVALEVGAPIRFAVPEEIEVLHFPFPREDSILCVKPALAS
jgi:hypothetical protein